MSKLISTTSRLRGRIAGLTVLLLMAGLFATNARAAEDVVHFGNSIEVEAPTPDVAAAPAAAAEAEPVDLKSLPTEAAVEPAPKPGARAATKPELDAVAPADRTRGQH